VLRATVALGAIAAALAFVPVAPARSRLCGRIEVASRMFQVVSLRGATCATARRVARAAHDGRSVAPWHCGSGMGHRYGGSDVARVCGRGGKGSLFKRPHAILTTFTETYPPPGMP
jgi:hypothetical protein